jgi:hypothetical protein
MRARTVTAVSLRNFILALFACILPLSAQYSQTITAQILNHTGSPNPALPNIGGLTNAIPNIGQASHWVTVTSYNNGSDVCAGVFSVQLIGSFNSPSGVSKLIDLPQATISSQATGSGSNVTRSYEANGVFPALNLRFVTYDPVNCVYDVFYAGTLSSGNVPSVTSNASTLALRKTTPVTINTMGANTVLATTGAALFLAVYGIEVCNAAAGTSITFQNAASATITYATYGPLAADTCIILPPGQLPLFSALGTGLLAGSPGQSVANTDTLVAFLSAATNVTYSIWYRYE